VHTHVADRHVESPISSASIGARKETGGLDEKATYITGRSRLATGPSQPKAGDYAIQQICFDIPFSFSNRRRWLGYGRDVQRSSTEKDRPACQRETGRAAKAKNLPIPTSSSPQSNIGDSYGVHQCQTDRKEERTRDCRPIWGLNWGLCSPYSRHNPW
jgi:hypothetical protein